MLDGLHETSKAAREDTIGLGAARKKAGIARSTNLFKEKIPLVIADPNDTKFAAHRGVRSENPRLARLPDGQGSHGAGCTHAARDDVHGAVERHNHRKARVGL